MQQQTKERLFDTSKCQVKFRKPRILDRRNREFDQDRDLTFDHRRVIDTRLQGVVFRDEPAVGFRNIGVGNIEEVSNPDDWPEVEPARSPDSLRIQRDSDWEETWGREQSFEQKWGGTRKNVDESKLYLYSRDRSQPRLSYVGQRMANQRKTTNAKDRATARQHMTREPVRQTHQPAAPAPRPKPKPVVEVVQQPIPAPPSTYINVPVRTSHVKQATASEKKRAFAFNEYALLLMESGEYDRAMNYFQKALDLDPGEGTYNINMNRCKEWLDYKKRGGRR